MAMIIQSPFAVQLPCQRHFRREDRVAQVFRTFSGRVIQFGGERPVLTDLVVPLNKAKKLGSES